MIAFNDVDSVNSSRGLTVAHMISASILLLGKYWEKWSVVMRASLIHGACCFPFNYCFLFCFS